MSQSIIIAHLYPREMNIYGDYGNVLTLRRRLEWRGFEVQVVNVEVGSEYDLGQADIIFAGGGQDQGQCVVADDLQLRAGQLRELAADGLPMLMICGMYQLFGASFTTVNGDTLPGIEVFKSNTVAGSTRMIGNVAVETQWGKLVGFENHSGSTILAQGQAPLGRVLRGNGNNPKSGEEGAVSHNVVGTYLHGPLLPQNPALADWLILQALKRKYQIEELEPLDDELEQQAHSAAAGRPR